MTDDWALWMGKRLTGKGWAAAEQVAVKALSGKPVRAYLHGSGKVWLSPAEGRRLMAIRKKVFADPFTLVPEVITFIFVAAQRILNRAAVLLTQGVDPIDAIEQACAEVSTTFGARERARNIFLALAARIERNT